MSADATPMQATPLFFIFWNPFQPSHNSYQDFNLISTISEYTSEKPITRNAGGQFPE